MNKLLATRVALVAATLSLCAYAQQPALAQAAAQPSSSPSTAPQSSSPQSSSPQAMASSPSAQRTSASPAPEQQASPAAAVTLPQAVSSQAQPQSQPAAEQQGLEPSQPSQSGDRQRVAYGSPSLRVSPGDEIEISVLGAPELSEKGRVNSDGTVYMPLAGLVHVAGLSSEQAQEEIRRRLIAGNYFNDPQVTFYVKDYTGEGISVTGEVTHPGLYSPLGPHRLLDVLQLSGGVTASAGRKVVIAHRDHPENAETLVLSDDPLLVAQDNVELKAGDTVVVSRARLVYVIGEANQPGGYTVDETSPTTVLKVITLAKGPGPNASLKRAVVLHRKAGVLSEEPIRLDRIMKAKMQDVPLSADDILYIPGKHNLAVNSNTLVSTLTTLAIYRGF